MPPQRSASPVAQLNRPWLEPGKHEGTHGLVSKVAFVEELVCFLDSWFAYYVQSASALGVATYRLEERYSVLGLC